MPTANDDEALVAWIRSIPEPETSILAEGARVPAPARKAAVEAARRLVGPGHREAVGAIATEIEAILRIYAPAPSAPGDGAREAPVSHVG